MTTLTNHALRDIDRIKNLVLSVPLQHGYNEVERKGFSFPVDLYETPDASVIVADLPGVSKDDLKVQIVQNQLHIFGVRKNPNSAEYLRSFHLPDPGVKVQAHFKDGVLTVKLPKPGRVESIHIPMTADSNFTI
ncbi:MAG: Hsp20/alpha crystallin family protein [Candidatus Latescibacteria bacterium]|nr:Hsp20/alpha crystallin family protein [Candidatus Latescibacterota bacterium]